MPNPCDLPILDRTPQQVIDCSRLASIALRDGVLNTPDQVSIGQWILVAIGCFILFVVISLIGFIVVNLIPVKIYSEPKAKTGLFHRHPEIPHYIHAAIILFCFVALVIMMKTNDTKNEISGISLVLFSIWPVLLMAHSIRAGMKVRQR